MKKKIWILLLFLVHTSLLFAAKPEEPDAARLQLELKKLTVLGRVMYVGAHPDDENTAVLSYLSLGRSVQTAYLSLTRGDGGQNLIGTEQGDLLGVIRTQELLAARQVDDAEQFFTRAIDFGFTKSPDETIRFWGKENILSDMVWIIRSFRPDVIISRFTKEGGGHGQHTASAILAEEAFQMAGDPSKFPEQLKYVEPWRPKRIVWNSYSRQGTEPTEQEKQTLAKMEIGQYNPLLGKSYTEIAGLSRSMHKSQGMGDSEDRGKFMNYFQLVAGDPMGTDVLDGVDLTWNRIPGGQQVGELLENAYRSFRPAQPSASIPELLKAYRLMQKLPQSIEVQEKKKDLVRVVKACAGIWLEAIAAEPSASPGNEVKAAVTALNRSDLEFHLDSVRVDSNAVVETPETLGNNIPFTKEFNLKIPVDMPYTQPYWLQKKHDGSSVYSVSNPQWIGMAETPAPFLAKFVLSINGEALEIEEPLQFRWIDPVEGERYRTFEVLPELAIHVKDPVTVFTGNSPKTIRLVLTNRTTSAAGEVSLKLPDGWSCNPKTIPFQLANKNESVELRFTVQPSDRALRGRFLAEASFSGKTISTDVISIEYRHFSPQTVLAPAEGILLPIDLKKHGENIGYIMGSGDQIPEFLEQVGYHVVTLSDIDLTSADLSRFDSIVIGIRAYNTRSALRAAQPRLLEYIKNGGTLVAQYNNLSRSGACRSRTLPISPFPGSRFRGRFHSNHPCSGTSASKYS